MAASADDKERTLMGAIIGAELAAFTVKQAKDGSDLSAGVIAKAAGVLSANGRWGLQYLPTTSRGSAMKDPESQRGKVIMVSGHVVQIHREGSIFWGTIMTDNFNAFYYITPFGTGQIEEGTFATFRGIFVQEYDYPNVSGGETQAAALVGAFESWRI